MADYPTMENNMDAPMEKVGAPPVADYGQPVGMQAE